MNPLPKRSLAHVIGDEAVRLFVEACPKEWVKAPLAPDYGLDLRVELARDGAVTGEEFGVQIKGSKRLRCARGHVTLRVRHSTVNYWLGKLQPTMVAAVDTECHRFWFGWLEHLYPDYPRRFSSDGEIEFSLMSESSPEFGDHVLRYICHYYYRLRDETTLLGDRLPLSRLLLHTSSLARTLTQIHLELTCGKPMEELQNSLHFMFLEYGIHDSFLFSLCEPESPWKQHLSSRVATIVTSKLEEYVGLRSHFWMREQRVGSGDFDFIPFSYSGLRRYLIPTLESVWDLQDALAQLLALGSVIGSQANQAPIVR
jgi:hypothetical protein